MKKPMYQEYILTCLSPVHVGNGASLRAFEYLYDKEHQIVYFPDASRWIDLLSRHRLMDAFAVYIGQISKALNQRTPFIMKNLWEWLLYKGVTPEEIRQASTHAAKADRNAMMSEKSSLNDIAMQAAQGNGHPYLPGSTIKGALRTGLLYHLLQQDEDVRKRYRNCLEHKNFTAIREKWKREKTATTIASELEDELLAKLQPNAKALSIYKFAKEARSPMLLSVMRGILVSDAICVEEAQETIIVKKIDASMNKKKNRIEDKELPLARECLPAGAKLRFSIALHPEMLREVGITDIGQLLDAARSYVQYGLSLQAHLFARAHQKELDEARLADLLLGGGTGFLTKTLDYPIFDDFPSGKRFVQQVLQANFKNHKHDNLDRQLSPRTLKLVNNGAGYSLMGLCQICEVVR